MDSHGTTKLRDGMSDMRNIPMHQVQQRPRDINVTSVSTGSNRSEISKAMEKILEMNQLLAQQQMAQQKTLQALLYHQEQTSEVQEASQRI